MTAPGYLPEGYKQSKRRRPKQADSDGREVGYEVEHWDGRQDAVIRPDPVKLNLRAATVAVKGENDG